MCVLCWSPHLVAHAELLRARKGVEAGDGRADREAEVELAQVAWLGLESGLGLVLGLGVRVRVRVGVGVMLTALVDEGVGVLLQAEVSVGLG